MEVKRTRNLIKNMFSSFFFRFFGMAITLILTPMLIKTLTVEQYAVFAVVISFSVFLAYSDFGLGLSLVNKLPVMSDEDKRKEISYIFTVLVYIGGFVFSFIGLFLLFSEAEPWRKEAWVIFLIVSCLSIPFSLGYRVLFSLDKIHVSNLWLNCGRFFILVLVFFLYIVSFDGLWMYILVYAGVPLITSVVLWWWLMMKYSFVRFECLKIKFSYTIHRLKQSAAFLILQISVFFDFGVDVVIISSFYDEYVVRDYDLLVKLYMYVPALMSVCLLPIWPAVRSALRQKDYNWIKKIGYYSFFFVLIVSLIVSSFFMIYSHQIVKLWVGIDMNVDELVIWGFSFFSILVSLAMLQSVFLNAMNIIREQAIIAALYIALMLLIKIFMLNYFGLAAMVISGAFVYFLRLLIAQLFIRKYQFGEVL